MQALVYRAKFQIRRECGTERQVVSWKTKGGFPAAAVRLPPFLFRPKRRQLDVSTSHGLVIYAYQMQKHLSRFPTATDRLRCQFRHQLYLPR